MHRWLGCLPISIVLASCAVPGTRQTLAHLETEQQRQAERLAQIQAEIALSERRAEEARRQAVYQECRASAAGIDAGVALRRAKCAHEVAEQQACLAAGERQKTETAVGGCGLGLLIGVLSGGSLAAFTLAGCGAGMVAGTAAQEECPAPACLKEAHHWLADEAEEHGRAGIPLCRAGIEIAERVVVVPQALQLTHVVAGTAADMAGMQEGDILFRVDGRRVFTDDELGAAVAGIVPEEPFRVEYVRNGQLHGGWGILTGKIIAMHGRPLLGVQYEDGRELRYGVVTVSAVASGMPLAVGDRIVAVGRERVATARIVTLAASQGATLPLTIERDNVLFDLEIELAP